MTHELILTSVARGLAPNDCGFCPVAANSEVSPRMIQHLIELSGYRYLVAESGGLPQRSLVAYSHLVLPGGLEHVLSRAAGVGTDYRGQPNVLAHHVVLEGKECPAESPAWLLALPGFHLSEWNAPPTRFTRGRPIPTLTNPPSLTRRQKIARQCHWLDPLKMALSSSVDTESESYRTAIQSNDEQIVLAVPPTTPCPAWEELTGDSGWGGVLAETVFTGQPVVLIYYPEQNILPLYVEALALLPEYVAWRTTFCTYFTGFSEAFPCQWKGVVANSEDVKPLVKDLNNLVIDLTVPMGEAREGRYVDFARFGQEHMLPLDMEEYAVSIAATKAETKFPGNDTKLKADKLDTMSTPVLVKVPQPPTIQRPPRRMGSLETFLRRSSRLQFYLLYSIMFTLVLFLLFLAVDQVGNFGFVQSLRNGDQPSPVVPLDEPHDLEQPPEIIFSELNSSMESIVEQIGQEVFTEIDNTRKTFEENRAMQREPLLQYLADFNVPEFLAISFPNVQNNQIDVPEAKTFDKLSPFYDFGAALELQFIPLFELPTMRVKTSPVIDARRPDYVWRVSAIDHETDEATPMFLFQLTETGLEMTWQLEGLNNQYLYDTVLSSLGFLQLSVADVPESAREIPLFIPVETTPMKVSDLANLAEQESPKYAVDLPFASELWREIFATMNPPRTLRLEVRAEPAGDWVRTITPSESEFRAEVRTMQQTGRQTGSGETVFANISILFSAEVLLERIVWSGDEYADRLRTEQEDIRIKREALEKRIDQLGTQAFEGNDNARKERNKYNDELQTLKHQHDEIENILEKLPAVYREINGNESGCFHCSVFLESESTNRQLLILRTVPSPL